MIQPDKLDYSKWGGIIPAIVQDEVTRCILMVGFMNEEALSITMSTGKVTFFSRTKRRLWTKGETSGNYLYVKNILTDCDNDSLLVLAEPAGPVCHTGSYSCFDEKTGKGFLYRLEKIIEQRISDNVQNSYVNKLYVKGINKIAQKVGEEAVELVIESKDSNAELFRNEAADLLFHTLILLKAKGVKLEEIEELLRERHRS